MTLKNENNLFRISPCLVIGLSLALLGATDLPSALAQADGSTAPAAQQAPAEQPVDLFSKELQQAGESFKIARDDNSWAKFNNSLRNYLAEGKTSRWPAQNLIAKNPVLKDLGVRAIDAGGARVWSFPSIAQAKQIILQTNSQVPNQSQNPNGQEQTGTSLVSIDLPAGAMVQEAQFVSSSTTTTQTVKVGKKTVTKTIKSPGSRFLILSGAKRDSGLLYLDAYKFYQDSWVRAGEAFSKIPAGFLENVAGKASFAGSSIILNLSSQNGGDSKAPKPHSSAYQLVLKLQGNSYTLGEQAPADAPASVISYFLRSIRQGQRELAKAWVKDEHLLDIPGYAKIFEGESTPFKLVSMSSPPTGGPRLRLVTSKSHDLIFDFTKEKERWLIRGIFIAPPDPLTRQLTGTPLNVSAPVGPSPKS